MRLPLLLTGLALSIVPLAACGGSDAEASTAVLRFGAIPDEASADLEARFAPLAEYLAAELGVEVEYVSATSYEAVVGQFKNGDVQLAWFGGLSGAQARAAIEGSRAIAQGTLDPEFVSYFIANASTGIEPSDSFPMELEGRSFTFGGRSSTSGRLMPEHFIREATGKAPADFFGNEENAYSGGHDQTAQLVQAGTFEAGALNYTVYDAGVASGAIDPEVCRKIWTTPTYADYNWTAHPVLEERYGEGFIDKVQQAILAIDDQEILASMKRPDGFIAASNADFQQIHDLGESLELLR